MGKPQRVKDLVLKGERMEDRFLLDIQ